MISQIQSYVCYECTVGRVYYKSHEYDKSKATQLQAHIYASAVCSPQARHTRAAVCDYENREFEQNQ